jgi:hypothetical protein
MLEAAGSPEKTIMCLEKLILPLRQALVNKNPQVWSNSCESLGLLAEVSGEHLTPHIHILMGQLNVKLQVKSLRDTVMATLHKIEQHCGPDAMKVIKTKIPTYVSMQ